MGTAHRGAVMSLSRLWVDTGQEGRSSQAVGRYLWLVIEGFDTKDWQEAKPLLEELKR